MSAGDVLCIDVGATSIKSRLFSVGGVALGSRVKRPTPKPCSPDRLIEVIANRSGELTARRIGVGFPGDLDDGFVVDAANLARRTGPGSPIEPSLFTQWSGFDLAGELQRATGAEIRVANDALMAARGCLVGPGMEMVLTLGTGCGVALAKDGVATASRDFGSEQLVEGSSFDELLGELARRRSESDWLSHVLLAIDVIGAEYDVTTVHVAGGNARRLSPRDFQSLDVAVVIERDDPALLGAWRSFYP